MVFEPHVGGSVYDRATDGTECRWGEVLAYDPPRRFVITWNINLQWQLETDKANVSEVEVTFVPDGPNATRVELTHRHLERHGPGWEQIRDGVGSPDGWKRGLALFAAAGRDATLRRARLVTTFVVRLLPPRTTFALDMTDEERQIMGRHAAHWQPMIDCRPYGGLWARPGRNGLVGPCGGRIRERGGASCVRRPGPSRDNENCHDRDGEDAGRVRAPELTDQRRMGVAEANPAGSPMATVSGIHGNPTRN